MTEGVVTFKKHIIALLFIALTLFSHSAFPNQTHESDYCVSCHKQEVRNWQQSHHFHAMAHIASASNLGDFNDQALTFDGGKARFYTENDAYYVEMPDLKGIQKRYEVLYTFGYYPLQQYMFDIGNGKIQLFPFAWDSRPEAQGGQRWFHLYPEQQPTDEFHWSQMGQNWNQNCADCHSTNFKKGFDLTSKSYQSEYDVINVSCSACHGDTSGHLEWVKSPDKDILHKGFSAYIGAKTPVFVNDEASNLSPASDLQDSKQIQTCATCHSRRAHNQDRTSSDNFWQDYTPSLITSGLYHADGQIYDEVYVWGSFLQSKMYQQGVTCTNCHNPHSGELKLPGNQTCTQCHAATTYDVVSHHHHGKSRAGSQCVDCHMPQTTYMQVDPRRDHSFSIPNPDISIATGSPNACLSCHNEQSNYWVIQHLTGWFPDSIIRNRPHFAKAFIGDRQARPSLDEIARQAQWTDLVRASAMAKMPTQGIQPESELIRSHVASNNPLLQLGAIDSVEPLAPIERWELLKSLLNSENRSVRIAAARTLAPALVQLTNEQDRQVLLAVIDELMMSLDYQSDRGWSHAQRADIYQQMGDASNTENSLIRAIDIEPIYMPAYANLADLYRAQSRDDEGKNVLLSALKVNPEAYQIHYSLALLHIRQGDRDKASVNLKTAADIGINDFNVQYVYSVLLMEQAELNNAQIYLKRALKIQPENPRVLYAIVDINMRQKDWKEALYYAEKMLQLAPGNPQVRALVERIQFMKASTKK